MATKHLFISYAEQDQPLIDILETHLSMLKRLGLITIWHMGKIIAGQTQAAEIDAYFERADIILICISADFLASDYHYSREMERALQRQKSSQACVIPILLRPVDITGLPFTGVKMLPTNKKPVLDWSNREDAFVDIAQGIAQAARGEPIKQNHKGKKRSGNAFFLEFIVVFFTLTIGLLCITGIISTAFFLYQHLSLVPLIIIIGTVLGLILLSGSVVFVRRRLSRREWVGDFYLHDNAAPSRSCIFILFAIIGCVVIVYFLFQHHEELPRLLIVLSFLLLITGGGMYLFEVSERRDNLFREVQQQKNGRREYYDQVWQIYAQIFSPDDLEDMTLSMADAVTQRGMAREIAMALVGRGKYEAALTLLEGEAVSSPNAAVYVSMGDVLSALGRYDMAVAAYKRALDFQSTYGLAYRGMYKVLKQLGKRYEAKKALREARHVGF